MSSFHRPERSRSLDLVDFLRLRLHLLHDMYNETTFSFKRLATTVPANTLLCNDTCAGVKRHKRWSSIDGVYLIRRNLVEYFLWLGMLLTQNGALDGFCHMWEGMICMITAMMVRF